MYVCFVYFSKDSACQKFNMKHRCYILDPFCQPNANEETDGNLVTYIAIGIVVPVILVVCCVLFCYLRKRRNKSQGMLNNINENGYPQNVNI